ncbi:MAG: hypothetical protein PWQ91_68 [Eubacteriales bacterium]|nr:hypothetical protein [Eubacteriales bacterium]MDN5363007.1 hypothetical protein [Eubacteriales bacterium]
MEAILIALVLIGFGYFIGKNRKEPHYYRSFSSHDSQFARGKEENMTWEEADALRRMVLQGLANSPAFIIRYREAYESIVRELFRQLNKVPPFVIAYTALQFVTQILFWQWEDGAEAVKEDEENLKRLIDILEKKGLEHPAYPLLASLYLAQQYSVVLGELASRLGRE